MHLQPKYVPLIQESNARPYGVWADTLTTKHTGQGSAHLEMHFCGCHMSMCMYTYVQGGNSGTNLPNKKVTDPFRNFKNEYNWLVVYSFCLQTSTDQLLGAHHDHNKDE